MGLDITAEISRLQQEADYTKTMREYQSRAFASLYLINHMLMYVYYGLFAIFALFIGWTKYVRGGGVGRNVYKDMGSLVGFATLPFWAIYLEELVYRVFSFIGSLLWGKIYVNNFYKMFNTTNFYSAPDAPTAPTA